MKKTNKAIERLKAAGWTEIPAQGKFLVSVWAPPKTDLGPFSGTDLAALHAKISGLKLTEAPLAEEENE